MSDASAVGEDSSTCIDGGSSKVQFVTLENAQVRVYIVLVDHSLASS